MQKKIGRIFLLVLVLTLLTAIPAQAWRNCVWISTDLELEARKMGYFNRGEIMTKVVSEATENSHAFDISLSNTIVDFDRRSGLYGELGVNLRKSVGLQFGGGFIHSNPTTGLLLTVGTRYSFQEEKLVNGIECFYRILSPLVLQLSYDDHSKNIYLGLGITFQ
ncbi:MAG: hypothetical protein GX085_00660 [Firmicutes bacterium]|nr:hypothetical protein [Bacillota bacterium]